MLARAHMGEATTLVTVLTPELGLVQARVQSLRKSGAKLAHALTTFAESKLVLVRGKEGWRLTGAVLEENWFVKLRESHTRMRAARVSDLLLRLVAGEAQDSLLFPIISGLFTTLTTSPESSHEAAEMLAVLRTLEALGFDSGEALNSSSILFNPVLLETILAERSYYISRINAGIAASGL